MLSQPASAGQVTNDFPGELAWRGMAIFPAIHGRDGDGDLVRELFLGEAESLPQTADQDFAIGTHQVVSPRIRGLAASASSNPHAMSVRAFRRRPTLC